MRIRIENEMPIYGLNAVRALAEVHPEEINRFFLRKEHMTEFGNLCKSLAERRHPYKICEDEELERLAKSPRHQGLVAMIAPRSVAPLTVEELKKIVAEGKDFLVLDSVGNDHNLGAIARSAVFFNIPNIIVNSGDEQARLASSAHRVAEGGLERVRVYSVGNLGNFLNDIQKDVLVIGADHRARNRLDELDELRKQAVKKLFGAASSRFGLGANIPCAIVLGNEERGLSDSAKKACAILLRIAGTGLMESLNVAQAANLFMYELYKG